MVKIIMSSVAASSWISFFALSWLSAVAEKYQTGACFWLLLVFICLAIGASIAAEQLEN